MQSKLLLKQTLSTIARQLPRLPQPRSRRLLPRSFFLYIPCLGSSLSCLSAPTSSYSFGSDKTVTPVASNPANVASPAHAVGTNAPSAAVLRAALPAYSLLGVVASLFALAHLL